MKCVSCSHDYTQSLILNYADFFAWGFWDPMETNSRSC
jgi:hypothetical protein